MNVWKYWAGNKSDAPANADDAVIVTVASSSTTSTSTSTTTSTTSLNANSSIGETNTTRRSSTAGGRRTITSDHESANTSSTSNSNSNSSSSSTSNSSSSLNSSNTHGSDTVTEFERKIKVLSSCLETKAEENITLYEQLEKAKKHISRLESDAHRVSLLDRLLKERDEALAQREEQTAHLAEQLATTELDKLQLQDMKEEYERRIHALSVCLEEMASENMQFWKSSETTSDRKDMSTSSGSVNNVSNSNAPNAMHLITTTPVQALLDEVRKTGDDRSEVVMKLREELEESKKKLIANDKRVVQLNTKLMDAINKKCSLEESNELYEQKLKALEKEMMENLHQEGIRRQEAEYIVSKLRKKVAELQFLLDEREQESSEEEEEDEDSD